MIGRCYNVSGLSLVDVGFQTDWFLSWNEEIRLGAMPFVIHTYNNQIADVASHN